MENGRETKTATRDVRFDFTYTPEKNGGQRTISLDASSENEARLKFHKLTGCSMYDSFKVHCADGEVERLYSLTQAERGAA